MNTSVIRFTKRTYLDEVIDYWDSPSTIVIAIKIYRPLASCLSTSLNGLEYVDQSPFRSYLGLSQ